MPNTEDARLFREAWIAGVRRHFPGESKAGYVTQQETDADVFEAIEKSLT
ncbi:hypothetical protein [Streptomyces sp. CMSTAAHL-2]|nr:hypothetical protein [Streptomyces sp. CMSTAAHL-2]MCE3031704.1 hypothetical protein [Streptomyces sp. CMSTAAHL-2]